MQENERNAEEERRPQFEFMLLLALRMVPPTARQIVLHFERWYFKPFPHSHRLKYNGTSIMSITKADFILLDLCKKNGKYQNTKTSNWRNSHQKFPTNSFTENFSTFIISPKFRYFHCNILCQVYIYSYILCHVYICILFLELMGKQPTWAGHGKCGKETREQEQRWQRSTHCKSFIIAHNAQIANLW